MFPFLNGSNFYCSCNFFTFHFIQSVCTSFVEHTKWKKQNVILYFVILKPESDKAPTGVEPKSEEAERDEAESEEMKQQIRRLRSRSNPGCWLHSARKKIRKEATARKILGPGPSNESFRRRLS